MSELSIWQRRNKLDKDRREKRMAEMEEYDKTIYYPAIRELIKECEQEGHTFGSFHTNGLGWSWSYCSKCRGRYNIEGPWAPDSTENVD